MYCIIGHLSVLITQQQDMKIAGCKTRNKILKHFSRKFEQGLYAFSGCRPTRNFLCGYFSLREQ